MNMKNGPFCVYLLFKRINKSSELGTTAVDDDEFRIRWLIF